jgi:branched-chain amino acid transport system ATP-binding protein
MSHEIAVLEVEGLSCSFGGLKVIDNLDFVVNAGDLLGLIGPNGAGKTTLFNLIAGVVPPAGGVIRYRGRAITRLNAWDRCRLGIGRTYQIPKPFPHMTVFENVLVAAVHGAGVSIRHGRQRSETVLRLTGMAVHHAQAAGQLSLLDLKRLELCRALALGPQLLVLDVIASGLTDPECDALLGIIWRIHSEGTAIVWVEHVIHALRRLCTRLAVLHGGSFIASGDPQQILADERVKSVYLGP